MKALLLALSMLCFLSVNAQKDYVGPPNNVGREYGNPKMPMMVSHLAGANKERLKRANKNSRHSIFGKILCFRKLCRIQSGHTTSLKTVKFKKFEKKVARNAKKGLYKRPQIDTVQRSRPMVPQLKPIVIDATTIKTFHEMKADSLIILGAELLFDENKSTLKSEHFPTLDPIVNYLISHPDRSVKISGHTDNTGTQQHNLTLSKRRADVVAEYLVDNGINIDRVSTFGFGSEKPIAPNTTNEGRKKNRRVELLIHGEE